MTDTSATAFFRQAAEQPQEWYHGSGAAFDRFDLNKNKTVQEDDDAKHWNSHLGAHFTSDHRVAQEFAQRQGGGHVYHAHLDLKNPKHYSSEYDLDREAVHWAHDNGHDMGPSFNNPAYRAQTEPDEWQFHIKYGEDGAPRPEAREIAHGFREHLRTQGHDGITYGNEFEGAHNGFHADEKHTSAIAFHPDQIRATHRHGGNEPCQGHTAGLTRQTSEHGWHQHPDSPHIVRGLVAQPDEGIHRDVAHRLMTGTADHHDVLGLINTEHAGHYWYTHGHGPERDSLPDSKTYAHDEEHLQRWHGQAEPEDTHISGAVGVAMVGHRPKGWNPDDNGDYGLMGNSHLPDNSHIHLHELHYTPDGGETWHKTTVPHGTMVHTDGPPKTATAFFGQAAAPESQEDDHVRHDEARRTAGRGKPRSQPRPERGAAGAGEDAAGGARGVAGGEGGAGAVGPRQVSFHPAAQKELGKLDAQSRKRVAATVDTLAQGGEGLQTHALTGPLKGWHSTKATRGHRVLHRSLDDGTLHVGYVGLHEYSKAINRLTGFFHTPPAAAPLTSLTAHFRAEAAPVDQSSGVMVAFSPPPEIAEQLARKDGQPADDLHVTLAYLGKTSAYTKEQLALLPRLVSSWAVRQKPVTIRTGGVGKFSKEHVLWASIDIPGGAQLHSDLARYLEGHGYRLPSEHGWSPHMTLQYVDRHFRFMPDLPEHHWTATEVETHIGGTCHKARLGHLPAGRIAP
ncbi:2'-5' RNA ligase family protein [Streptomyces sp. NPDC018055]|uniref:2'-5' RNA ligase family protein n=1 Tax=Streptomyces sp. NPDC018055 TaxID=3365038 RepID=UPI0037932DB8